MRVKYYLAYSLSLALLREIDRVKHRDTLILSVGVLAESLRAVFAAGQSHDRATERCITLLIILTYVTYFPHSCNRDGIFFLQ